MDTSLPKEPNSNDPYRESPLSTDPQPPVPQQPPETQEARHFSKDQILVRPSPRANTQKELIQPEELGQQIAAKLSARAAFVSASGGSVAEAEPQKQDPVRSALHAIRTYRGDVEDVVQTKNISMVSVVAAEEEKKAKEKKHDEVRKKTFLANIVYLVGSVVLLGAGATAVFYAYMASLPKDTSVPTNTKDASLVFSERSEIKILPIPSKERIMGILLEEKNAEDNPLGTFKRIFIASSSTSTDDIQSDVFFASIEADVQSTFVRSLEGTMMIGLHSYSKTVPFLMFKSESYEQTFNGMLRWESSMRENLSPFFDLGATTTLAIPFEGAILQNRDARVVRDEQGDIIFMYAFPDEKTLVITEHPDTFIEILRRLVSTKSIGG
jgi:hypothetical protein